MLVILEIVVFIIVLALIVAPFVFMHIRKIFREQKNYERSLKMVPLFIDLPPSSDDTYSNGRDVRDVSEETISKAQVIYNIIASTWQKGYKSKFYGQRHFAFEIVGTGGFVYFYAAVPVTLVEIVKQAINSAYPSARVEEASEHNIFSKVGKINGTLGGELVLKEPYAYPIATYQELKRDGMQSILSAMSGLTKEDGAAIQILMRPAGSGWRKEASSIASKKRKGEEKKKGTAALSSWGKSFITALSKPPEGGKEGGGGESKKELSNLEQANLDAIDDKTRYPGYETLIRVVVSSNVSQKAQNILSQVVASFSLFDSQGKNGFKYVPAKDVESLSTAYIMRSFPQENHDTILNSVELATIFHFPDQASIPTSQLVKQASKQVDGPRNVPEEGLLLGYNVFRGAKKPIRLSLHDRQRHIYSVGQTGTGKSMFLENLALQDMLSGNGFAFVDPHGDTVENLLAMVPKERTEDLIYFSPGDMEYPMGLNLFEFHSPEQKDFLIQEALNMLYKLYDPQHQGIMGPRYEHLFRMAALTVMADPEGGTFIDIPKLFRDPKYVDQKLKHVTDQTVIEFWKKEMPQSQRSNDFGEVVSWFVSKFGAFLSNDMMRNIIGQTKSAFDLRDIMDNKKILLVNLSKGGTGEMNSKLLGMIFVMKFQAAAMSRVDVPEDQRVDFSLFVDEFQNFSTDSLATIMSEARKFRLNLIVANQFTTQLSNEIRDAVFGNIGTIVSFRIGQQDVDTIGKYFQPIFDAEDLLRVPNYNTVVRTLIGGVPTQPFTMATLPQLGKPNRRLAEALKQLSAAKYGRPKAIVEKEIFARLATIEEPKPAFGSPASPFASPGTGAFGANQNPWASAVGGGGNKPATPQMSTRPAMGSGGSFIDDWLSKRQNAAPASPAAYPANLQSAGGGNFDTISTGASPYQSVSQSLNGNHASVQPSSSPAAFGDPLASRPGIQNHGNHMATELNNGSSPTHSTLPQSNDTNKNISSGELENEEIQKIAGEIRSELKNKGEEGQDASEKSSDHDQIEDGDTIFIDREGNMQMPKKSEVNENS